MIILSANGDNWYPFASAYNSNACLKYIGNPNSLHKLGVEASNLIDESTNQIASLLNVKPSEIIYTSGSSESNNLAIKGIAYRYKNRGMHIITTSLEHSSVTAPLNYLSTLGYEIDIVKLDKYGRVDLTDFKKLLRDDTILVTINSVNSETGITQPISEIKKIVKDSMENAVKLDVPLKADDSFGKNWYEVK